MDQHQTLPRLFVLLAAALISACHTPAGLVDVTPLLVTGEPQQRTIQSGEVHTYHLALPGDRFIRVYATQKGIDLTLTLLDPQDEQIATADGGAAAIANEVLVALTGPAGQYRLRVIAKHAPGDGGLYEVGLAENREIQPGDGSRLLGLRSYILAYQLGGPDARPETRRLVIHHLEEATTRFREIDDPLHGWTLLRLAQAHLALDEAQRAKEITLQAIADMNRHGMEAWKIGGYNSLGDALVVLDEPMAALKSYSDAIELAAQHDAINEQAINLNDRGILYRQLGDLERARSDLETALHLWQRFAEDNPHVEIGDHEVGATINLGIVYRRLGQMERAFALYERAAQLAKETEWIADELHLFSNLGRAYIAVGRLEDAHQTLKRGLELARELQKPLMEQAISANLGLLYRLLGQPQAALDSYRDSVDLASRLNRSDLTAESLIGIGHVQRELGDLAQALTSFRQALASSQDGAAVLLQADSLREIGTTLAALGAPEDGLSLLQEALTLAVDAPPPAIADHLVALAKVQEQLGRLREARATLLGAAELNLTLEDPIGQILLHAQLARLEQQVGDLDAAERSFAAALATHEQLRAQLVSPDRRASFLARWRDFYRAFIDLLVERHLRGSDRSGGAASPLARAVDVSERSRARVLVELLTEASINIREEIDPELLDREQALLTRISLLQNALIIDHSTMELEQRRRDRQAMKEALGDLQDLEDRIRREHRKYAEIRYPEPLDAAKLRDLLPPETAVLEYVLGTERSHLFVVRRQGISHHLLPPAREIGVEIRAFRQSIQAADPRSRTSRTQATNRLSRWLLAPVAPELVETQNLWVVPDGPLYYLPFEFLRTADGRYVVDQWTTAYVPSATTFATLKEPGTPARQDAAFVGFAAPTAGLIDDAPTGSETSERGGSLGSLPRFPPLPGSELEVRQIAALFPGRSRLFIGPEANKTNVAGQPLVQNARWLHFASHSWIDERNPARSAIILSPDPHGDALLPVAEIFNLKLNAEAVVLSACETGLGEVVDGEGLVGFTRAFLYAGSPHVVVSLWPVADEATAALMRRLYARLASGQGVADALRGAKRDLINDDTWSHPRYWASFILVGGRPGSTSE